MYQSHLGGSDVEEDNPSAAEAELNNSIIT